MRDDSGHLKVADFGVSKLLTVVDTVGEDRALMGQDSACEFISFIFSFYFWSSDLKF